MALKTVLITGASRGIGLACALQLSQKGYHIILIAKDEQKLNKVAHLCQARGATTEIHSVDLGSMTELQEKIHQILEKNTQIDVLINNAGLWLEETFEKGDLSAWDYSLEVNLKSVIHLTHHCLPNISSDGAIIFISSIASRKTYAGGTNYCATKFGLLGFAGSLFEDIREKGIKVSSIMPGYVNTDMHKDDITLASEKMIQPEDVAQTVQFILNMPHNVCPTEITLLPQKNPKTYGDKK